MNLDADQLQYVVVAAVALAVGGVVYATWSTLETAYEDARISTMAEAEATLSDMFSTLSPERVFQVSMALAVGAFAIGFVAINIVAAGFFGVGAFFVPRLYFQHARDKRALLFAEQLVDALGMMSNSLKAGLTLPQAMELVVREMSPPVTQEFGRVLQDYRLGTDLDDAMLAMARRVHSRDLDVLVNAIMVTRRSGGNVGEIFESIAIAIRERFRVEGKIRALASTGTAQAVLLSAMPFMLMAALYFVRPLYVVFLFSTTPGIISVSIVVLLVVGAYAWIRRIMNIDI